MSACVQQAIFTRSPCAFFFDSDVPSHASVFRPVRWIWIPLYWPIFDILKRFIIRGATHAFAIRDDGYLTVADSPRESRS